MSRSEERSSSPVVQWSSVFARPLGHSVTWPLFFCLLVACLLVTPLLALPPRFVPEWSRPLPGPPRFVRVIRWQPQNPAELLVGLESGELLLLSSDGDRLLAEYQCREPAFDACPVQDSSGSALLAVALARRILLLDRRLKALGEVPVPADGRLGVLRAGNVTGNRDEEIVGIDQRGAWVVTRGGKVLQHLEYRPVAGGLPQTAPSQALVCDLNHDGRDEIAVSDGSRLCVFDGAGRRLLTRTLSAAGDYRLSPSHCFDVGDLDRDCRLELVALERVEGHLQVTCWDLPDSLPCWSTRLPSGPPPAPRPPTPQVMTGSPLLHIADSDIYCAADSARGIWNLTRLDSTGRANLTVRREVGDGAVTDIQNCESDVILTGRTALGLQAVWSIALPGTTAAPVGGMSPLPDRTLGEVQGLGYNGVSIREVCARKVDNDALTDLLIIRSSPGGEHALDVFRNNRQAVQAALDTARAAYRTALRGGSRDAVRRTGRRLTAMASKAGLVANSATDPTLERQARLRSGLSLGLALLLTALALGIAALLYWFVRTVVRNRRARRSDAIVRPVPELLAIGSDTIALDHVFVSKGNTAGAIARIDELRRRHRLTQDPDLMRIRSVLEPYYSHYIYRLINRPKTIDFLSWLLATIRALPVETGLNVATLTREQLAQRLRAGDFRGEWLVKVQNWDAPDAIEHLRVYSDRVLERWLEHAIADNLRHAQTWSLVALEYTINTTWNRKLTVHFLNDGPGMVDLSHSDTHLGAQFQELHRLSGDFIEFSRSPRELMEYEKYWVRFWDYLSVLEDTHRRQTRGITGEL